jgi:hypothetical protein
MLLPSCECMPIKEAWYPPLISSWRMPLYVAHIYTLTVCSTQNSTQLDIWVTYGGEFLFITKHPCVLRNCRKLWSPCSLCFPMRASIHCKYVAIMLYILSHAHLNTCHMHTAAGAHPNTCMWVAFVSIHNPSLPAVEPADPCPVRPSPSRMCDGSYATSSPGAIIAIPPPQVHSACSCTN